MRVVSLNLCTDQMLVLLAPEKIAALSPLARDPSLSFVAPQAAHLPIVRASAEAVLRLRPDLILAAPYGAQPTLALLQQEGVPVLRIALPHDFAGIREMTRLLAATLGVPRRGEILLAAMDTRLDTLPHPDHEIRALAWEPRGLTAGPGTLMDAVLRAAGLNNDFGWPSRKPRDTAAASAGCAGGADGVRLSVPCHDTAGPPGARRAATPRDLAGVDHLRGPIQR